MDTDETGEPAACMSPSSAAEYTAPGTSKVFEPFVLPFPVPFCGNPAVNAAMVVNETDGDWPLDRPEPMLCDGERMISVLLPKALLPSGCAGLEPNDLLEMRLRFSWLLSGTDEVDLEEE